jgi:hypothetical protein
MLNWRIDTKRKRCKHNADLQSNLQLASGFENLNSPDIAALHIEIFYQMAA